MKTAFFSFFFFFFSFLSFFKIRSKPTSHLVLDEALDLCRLPALPRESTEHPLHAFEITVAGARALERRVVVMVMMMTMLVMPTVQLQAVGLLVPPTSTQGLR